MPKPCSKITGSYAKGMAVQNQEGNTKIADSLVTQPFRHLNGTNRNYFKDFTDLL